MKILFMCLAFVAGQKAYAESAPFYYASYSVQPKFESKTLRTTNTNYFPVGAQTSWGLVKFSYFSSRDRNAFFSFDSRKGHFRALGQGVQSWIQVVGLSASGQDLVMRFSFRNAAVGTVDGSRTLQFTANVYVSSCDGRSIVPQHQEALSLAERLEAGSLLSGVRYCKLSFRTVPSLGANFRSQGESISFNHADVQWDLQDNAIIVRSVVPNIVPKSSDGMAPNQVSGPREVILRYTLTTELNGKAIYQKGVARSALNAAQDYLAELTDYGDRALLLSIEDAPTRAAFHESYLSRQKLAHYERLIEMINKGMAHLPARKLVGLHADVNQAYEFIRYYEQEVLGWRHNFFDELSRRSLPSDL